MFWMFLSYAEIIWMGSCRLTHIKIQRMNLNNGDNQQNIQIYSEHLKTSFSLTVTIVEVHTLNLDICVSLHVPVQIISAKWLKNIQNTAGQNFV